MSNTYEKDITKSLGSARELILLGVRADADIDYRDKRVTALQTRIAELEKVAEAAEACDKLIGVDVTSEESYTLRANYRAALRAAGYLKEPAP